MEIVFLISGLILVLLVSVDILTTILFLGGGGIISNFISRGVWNVFFYLGNKKGRASLLKHSGLFILIILFSSWILLNWAGFTLIFLADTESVVDTQTEIPVDAIGKVYYVGYTLSSLGNGDLKPGNNVWRILSDMMGLYGIFFITLGISYLIPVLDAVIKKRTLSAYIYQLGKTPQEIISNGWNGKDFDLLYHHFNSLNTMILEHCERHLAYPVLHFFHSSHPKYSAPLTLAILDEAITIQEIYRLDKSDRAYNWTVIRLSISSFLEVLGAPEADPDEEMPPFPYHTTLKIIPAPNRYENEEKRLNDFAERRKSLYRLIQRDGWDWEDVTEITMEN